MYEIKIFHDPPYSIDEIFQMYIDTFMETKNLALATAAARILTARNRVYWSQFTYKNPPPDQPDPPEEV